MSEEESFYMIIRDFIVGKEPSLKTHVDIGANAAVTIPNPLHFFVGKEPNLDMHVNIEDISSN